MSMRLSFISFSSIEKMKTSTFQCTRSVNYQLHNKISQEYEYSSYLNRVRQIVDKKPNLDDSPRMYMQFLQRSKDTARNHKSGEYNNQLQVDNKHLLDKIIRNKQRKVDFSFHNYPLALHEKRHREIERINRENKKMVKRINQQHSVVRKNISMQNYHTTRTSRNETKNITAQGWNCSPLKSRKLPKLTQFYEFKNGEKKDD